MNSGLFFPKFSVICYTEEKPMVYSCRNKPNTNYMKSVLCFLVLLLFLSPKIKSQPLTDQAGARSWGCPGISATASDSWSVLNNQAAMAECKTHEASMYVGNQFAISDLNYLAFSAIVPVKQGNFGFSAGRFGNEKYNETRAGAAFAKMLANRFSAGLQINAFRTAIAEGYASSNKVSFEAGIKYSFAKNVSLGIHAFNPIRVKTAESFDQRIPTYLKMGLSWNYKNKALLAGELTQDIDGNRIFRAGVEYQLIQDFYIRGGMSVKPARGSFGMGYKVKSFQFDMAVCSHPQLPLSSHMSISYSL